MAAHCWACKDDLVSDDSVLDVPVGNLGEPLGACLNCQAFACGHHGIRRSNSEYVCVQCVPSLILSSVDIAAVVDQPVRDTKTGELVGSTRQVLAAVAADWSPGQIEAETMPLITRDAFEQTHLASVLGEAIGPQREPTPTDLVAIAALLTSLVYVGGEDPHHLRSAGATLSNL